MKKDLLCLLRAGKATTPETKGGHVQMDEQSLSHSRRAKV